MISYGKRTLVMGVLNITPDSFSDGGNFLNCNDAVRRAAEMAAEGADIIDVGGESTRPVTFNDGAPLEVEEELRRIIPAIRIISQELPDIPISVDTYKSEVAARALDAGASIVNDISGLTFDSSMTSVVAAAKVPVVIMHILGKPRNIGRPAYLDVVEDIIRFFNRQIGEAITEGVAPVNIILDPGIGFGKNLEHNLTILRRLHAFKDLGFPVLIGPSRKRFLGALLNSAPPDDRLEGTAAAVSIGIANGADIVRVHDVRAMARVVRVADSIVRGIARNTD